MTAQNTASIAELQQKAQAGDAQAQFDVALCYANGDGVEKDEVVAFEWHKQAVELGHVDAQFALGLYYFIGRAELQAIFKKWSEKFTNKNVNPAFDLAVSQAFSTNLTQTNNALAFNWLKIAAEKKHIEAQYYLALCYFEGKGVEQNHEIAFEWFEKAAKNNIIEAQDKLARCYRDGKGVGKNEVLAFEWFKKAADADFAEAQLELVSFYTQGIGVEKNDSLAFEYLKKAAEQNIAEAQYRLAQVYEQGAIVKQDLKLAFEWYKKASKNEFIEAKYQLANCYYDGRGVEKNNDLAFKYYQEASQAGHVLAKTKIGQMYCYTGLCIIFDKSKSDGYSEDDAFDFFTNSIEYGYLEAFREISEGYCIEFNKSYQRVINWYEEYDKQGYIEARNALAQIFFKYAVDFLIGYGVATDQNKAFELFLKAYEYGSTDAAFHLGLMRLNQAKYDNEIGDWVIEGFKITAEKSKNSRAKELANNCLAYCYSEGIGTDKNLELAEYHSRLGCKTVGRYDLVTLPPKSQLAKESSAEILSVHFENNDFSSAKKFLNQAFEDPKDVEIGFKKVGLMAVEQAEKLRKLNQELEEKNSELNNLVAMFAHNFLGTLQCIRSNAEHDNNPKIHLKTVKMMGGALTTFSILSANDDKLVEQLTQDVDGETNLQQSLANNLALAISQLLGKTNRDKIVNLYLHHLCKTGQIEIGTTSEVLRTNRDYRTKWQALQHQWEDEFNALFSENVELPRLRKWIADNFCPIEIIGFDSYNISFKEYGITDSIFLTIFMEVFVNAFKYMDANSNAPLIVKLFEEDQSFKLVCENPSCKQSGRGTHKGMDFLKTLAKKLGGQFVAESTDNSFKTTFTIPAELLR